MIFGWRDDTTYQSYRDSYVGVAVAYSRNTDFCRRIQDFPFMLVSRSGGVFFNGCIHCLCWGRIVPSGTHVIVAFDWSDENFRKVPLPAWFDGCQIPNLSVAVLGGCLCLVDGGDLMRTPLVEVWMMKKYRVRESWTKFSIGVPRWFGVEALCSLAENEFLVRTDANRVTVHCEGKLVVYNPTTESLRDVIVHGIPTHFTFGGPYAESIVSSDHEGGIGRR